MQQTTHSSEPVLTQQVDVDGCAPFCHVAADGASYPGMCRLHGTVCCCLGTGRTKLGAQVHLPLCFVLRLPSGSPSPNTQHEMIDASITMVPILVKRVSRSSMLHVSRKSTGTTSLLLQLREWIQDEED